MTQKLVTPFATVEVVSDEECERANYVVCALVRDEPSPVPNSYQTSCCECFRLIWVSPYSPLTPPKVCIECAAQMVLPQ